MQIRLLAAMLIGVATVAGLACGGGSSDKTATSAPATKAAGTAAATARPATAAASAAPPTASGGATTPQAGVSPAATAAGDSTGGGAVFDETQAKSLIDEASIKPADVGADWKIGSDTPIDNATAETNDPANAGDIERCGRLLGRTVTLTPADVVSAYLTGEIVSAFTQLTVYKTAEGATDCANAGAARLQAPGALARAFRTIFTTPDAVTVQPLTYDTVGDGSFAVALTGDTNASGTTVQIQIVLVAFRKGNTSAVVGIAQSPLTNPVASIVKPYIDLTLQRIVANQ